MSEITYIKCDGSGCEAMLTKIAYDTGGEAAGWTKDDLDADFCPGCSADAEKLAADAATAEDLKGFGEKIEAAADPILEEKKKAEAAEFDKALESTVKGVVKDLKKQKASQKYIDDVVAALREQAEELKVRKGLV